MSYNSEQCHYSYLCTDSSSPMVVIEGNEISNARDTTHERPTLEEVESLDDIEVATYTRRNRKKTSIVWMELVVVKLADRTKKVQCNHYKIKLAKNKDGTTTQYKMHLDGCMKRQTWKYDQAKIREVDSHMIMVHELPFAFTEYEIFTLLMKTASSHYVRISCVTTKTDCWTSYEGQKIQYMVLTAYFVDSDWDLQKKKVLNFVDEPPPHSGVVVYDALCKCLQNWGIEGKVCLISVDNASYNDAAVRMLKNSLSFYKRLPLNEKLFHVRCCAHILNLLVHDGLSEIENVIDNVRESVKHITTSTMCLTMFSDIVKQLQLPNKRLILDCYTRWNATYAMLSCVLEFNDVFPRYAQRNVSYKYLPSDKIGIKELLMEKSLSEELWMRQMVDEMQRKFDKYLGECNMLISIAIILNPRNMNKMKLIDFSFHAIYSEEEPPRHIRIVGDSLYKLYKEHVDEYATANVGISMENDVHECGVSNASTTSRIGKGKVMTRRSKVERYIRSVDTADNVKSELDIYL
ncbi:hypothetical protein Gogos_022357 [Gossypium gossypioides]|uniref:hAT-like transposase RNase-H fold domain-containing protein n=1 Tax=Gossypium gossypioides TaxID=34282 RepID=A0A7J9CYP7_GOSGO|nr:hypothetical protein [Gossypium gossypioides]